LYRKNVFLTQINRKIFFFPIFCFHCRLLKVIFLNFLCLACFFFLRFDSKKNENEIYIDLYSHINHNRRSKYYAVTHEWFICSRKSIS
jgi:hypothetical protein